VTGLTALGASSTGRALFASDIRGAVRLGFDATLGVMGLVESMHHTIAAGAPIVGRPVPGRTTGITGVVYSIVRGTTGLIGRGADAALGLLPEAAERAASAPEREAVLAALNGVWGDHLAASGNPLAIRMALSTGGRRVCPGGAGPAADRSGRRLLVLAHGLCMNDLQWSRRGHDHGAALARDLGFTPLYLHYNSGRHISQNGADFSDRLEELVAGWPFPVDEIAIVGHSMGGLVARSACDHAQRTGQRWRGALSALVFLGTPHHGTPLERGGHRLDTLFGISPYVAPFARLGKARSAGITDLRFGNLRDEDWMGRDRHAQRRDDRAPLALPADVPCFMVAAVRARAVSVRSAFIGDGLVPLGSALGRHSEPDRALRVPAERTRVFTSADHWDLLGRPDVYAQLRQWLE
jgi:hypothetical protein